MAIVLALSAIGAFAPPASAQVPIRLQTPIVAGSTVVTSSGRCTVGAVLMRYGAGSFRSPIAAATRYLVVAKHCADHIGRQFFMNGVLIGSVTWMSGTNDVELVQVPPEVPSAQACPSYGCFVDRVPRPRAVGQVILGPPNREARVSMLAPGSPAPGEPFCTSGSTTNTNCNWVSEPVRPPYWRSTEGLLARSTNATGIEAGDSGGAVVSQQGTFYGIIQRGGRFLDPNLMQYLPAAEIFRQIEGTYGIAPG
ncbi:hypothetical protein [Rathayibacter rathayi]|uniref:Peptidase S1 domain-containing protein n=1 Tax=Rathayibacter rathayi TaxID=33887 RepID=A0ABD6W6Q6_RATRA|nr:hypothetical protein [Rathayibacter rathayi]AZZ49483.1 hypothetical protein C1O28_09995 [Rathayibacter rathayi]MWV73594.1 hypothetical protein [Rathayibacter rathayi NCPPB 2980 = VKM Ac-1601]PPF11725.1 hypothetical protein C5C04_11605 [Rathayibacter rathayi]PPF22889.1 hypothetical protein C5C34_10870 [Rathayibacter rathayi]PPF47811.1 hypothetical protein C5C08_10525 [Rathayibacter rathayi]